MGVPVPRSPLPMPAPPSARVRFGAFEVDLATGEVRSMETPDANHKILLREQVFQVLRMLIDHKGQIVTREEIKTRLWANDTVVDFDHGINTTIKSLRRALGDSADNTQYIETLARRGYRLMVPVECLESIKATALEEVPEQGEHSAELSKNAARLQRQLKPRWRKVWPVLATTAILVVASFSSWRHFRATGRSGSEKMMLA